MVADWTIMTRELLQALWMKVVNFTPRLIVAIIVFLVGWILSAVIGKIVAEILRGIKFDRLFEKENWKKALEKAGIKMGMSGFIGAIVKWVLVIIVLLVSILILGLEEVRTLFDAIIGYLPNVIVAVAVFVITVIIADILEKVVRVSIESTQVKYAHIASEIVRWAIWVFAIILILYQLNIARPIMADLFRGIVFTIVISLGLAFGLGGKDIAAEILQDIRRKLKE